MPKKPAPSIPYSLRIPAKLYWAAQKQAARDGLTFAAWLKRLMVLAIRKGKP